MAKLTFNKLKVYLCRMKQPCRIAPRSYSPVARAGFEPPEVTNLLL